MRKTDYGVQVVQAPSQASSRRTSAIGGGEADVLRAPAAYRSDANDPIRTLRLGSMRLFV